MPNYLHKDSKYLATSCSCASCPACEVLCPEGVPGTDCLINPDLSAVVNVPSKYLKIVGETVSEMNSSEKTAKEVLLVAINNNRPPYPRL